MYNIAIFASNKLIDLITANIVIKLALGTGGAGNNQGATGGTASGFGSGGGGGGGTAAGGTASPGVIYVVRGLN